MKLAALACAFGKHSLDTDKLGRIHGSRVGRCRHCTAPMEEIAPQVWQIQRVPDAGLGRRYNL